MLVQGRVEFKDVAPGSPAPFRARHFGIARCDVPVDMTCRADLFDEGGQVSDIKGRGENRCRMASKYRRSDRYPPGESFDESFRYRLTLRPDRLRWSGTSNFCPSRKNHRKTLVCRDRHGTVAPQRHAVTHRN